MTARPVSVALTRPDTLFKVNEGSLTIPYANDAEALKTIEGDDLAKIDEGYYTVQYRFNLAEYIKQQEDGKTPYADENGEVRDGGIDLYAKAWVEVTDDGKTGEMLECIDTNNNRPHPHGESAQASRW